LSAQIKKLARNMSIKGKFLFVFELLIGLFSTEISLGIVFFKKKTRKSIGRQTNQQE
jgi:hypothetical protein